MERVTRRSLLPAVAAVSSLVLALSGCGTFSYKAAAPKKPSIAFESNVSADQDDVTVDTLEITPSDAVTLTKVSTVTSS